MKQKALFGSLMHEGREGRERREGREGRRVSGMFSAQAQRVSITETESSVYKQLLKLLILDDEMRTWTVNTCQLSSPPEASTCFSLTSGSLLEEAEQTSSSHRHIWSAVGGKRFQHKETAAITGPGRSGSGDAQTSSIFYLLWRCEIPAMPSACITNRARNLPVCC